MLRVYGAVLLKTNLSVATLTGNILQLLNRNLSVSLLNYSVATIFNRNHSIATLLYKNRTGTSLLNGTIL